MAILEKLLYRMYIIVNGIVYQLPVNPQTFKTNANSKNTEYNVLGIGDIVIPKTPALKTWEWEGLLPIDLSDPMVNSGSFFPPSFYINLLLTLQKNRTPFEFKANTLSLALNIFNMESSKVVIDSFNYEERGGEPADIYYSISIKEYRSPEPIKLTSLFEQVTNTISNTIVGAKLLANTIENEEDTFIETGKAIATKQRSIGKTVCEGQIGYYSGYTYEDYELKNKYKLLNNEYIIISLVKKTKDGDRFYIKNNVTNSLLGWIKNDNLIIGNNI